MNKKLSSLMALCGLTSALVLSACAAAPSADTEAHTDKTHSHMATVKPGAATSLTHTVDGDLQVGRFTDVVLTLSHDYDTGTVIMTPSASEGLELLSNAPHTVLASSTNGASTWRVAVRPAHDGEHFLSVQATASQDKRSRVHTVRLDMGGKSDTSSDQQKPSVIQLNGQTASAFEAEESISPNED